jgi:nucleoside-diphosphate-sugar epimerase
MSKGYNWQMLKTLLIGSEGYVGSFISKYLPGLLDVELNHCDFLAGAKASYPCRYQELESKDLASFDSIIWSAGHSSVSQAINDPVGALHNNLTDLFELALKLNSSQTLVYASSASVYNGITQPPATEDAQTNPPVNVYDLSKKWFDELHDFSTCHMIGLRFGTITGVSPKMRDELIINSMVKAAMQKGVVDIFNQDNFRSVLALKDMLSAIEIAITGTLDQGIYNLASFSDTIGGFGRRISEITGAEYRITAGSSAYSFQMSTKKMEQCSKWKPQETLSSCVADLMELYR